MLARCFFPARMWTCFSERENARARILFTILRGYKGKLLRTRHKLTYRMSVSVLRQSKFELVKWVWKSLHKVFSFTFNFPFLFFERKNLIFNCSRGVEKFARFLTRRIEIFSYFSVEAEQKPVIGVKMSFSFLESEVRNYTALQNTYS